MFRLHQVEAEQPIAKAQSLLQRGLERCQRLQVAGQHGVLTLAFIVHGGKGNIRDTAIRDHAFKLRPLALSTDLITQLKACAVKLQHWADVLPVTDFQEV